MAEIWTRLKFYLDDTCFSRDLIEAQAHDSSLRRIRVASSQKVEHEYIDYEVVELIVAPELTAIWQMAVSDETSLEAMAARHIQARSKAVLSKQPGYIPF